MQALLIRSAASAVAIVFLAAAPAGQLDKPLDVKVIALPADPLNQHAKPKRSCTYYPGFVVKEIDRGEVGAEEQAVIPLPKGGKPPACEAKIKHEIVIKAADWSGYFDGAKGDFLLYDAADGINNGLPFAVFDSTTGKKLFEDSRQGDAFASVALKDGGLVLQYRRVWLAPCSLMADAKGCWKKIMALTALAPSARPDCSAEYREAMKAWPKSAETTERLPTVIAYNAEARFAKGKLSITPLPGKTECWLED
jgi:hypothetical protein